MSQGFGLILFNFLASECYAKQVWVATSFDDVARMRKMTIKVATAHADAISIFVERDQWRVLRDRVAARKQFRCSLAPKCQIHFVAAACFCPDGENRI